jgi:hypothetical protein
MPVLRDGVVDGDQGLMTTATITLLLAFGGKGRIAIAVVVSQPHPTKEGIIQPTRTLSYGGAGLNHRVDKEGLRKVRRPLLFDQQGGPRAGGLGEDATPSSLSSANSRTYSFGQSRITRRTPMVWRG